MAARGATVTTELPVTVADTVSVVDTVLVAGGDEVHPIAKDVDAVVGGHEGVVGRNDRKERYAVGLCWK